jgi:hypothetical protein
MKGIYRILQGISLEMLLKSFHQGTHVKPNGLAK